MEGKVKYCIIENFDEWRVPLFLNLQSLLVGYPYMLEYSQKEEIETELSLIANERHTAAKVPGYSIFITPKFTLDGSRIESKEELLKQLREMAEFYLHYRIEKRPGKYLKMRDDYYPGCPGDWKPWDKEKVAAKKAAKEAARAKREEDDF